MQAKADKKRIRQLEQELRRKDKTLAEAAALLILQKTRCLLEQRRRGRLTSLPLGQIVPRLVDRGCYLASKSSFYHILRDVDQHHRRGRSEPPRRIPATTSYTAT